MSLHRFPFQSLLGSRIKEQNHLPGKYSRFRSGVVEFANLLKGLQGLFGLIQFGLVFRVETGSSTSGGALEVKDDFSFPSMERMIFWRFSASLCRLSASTPIPDLRSRKIEPSEVTTRGARGRRVDPLEFGSPGGSENRSFVSLQKDRLVVFGYVGKDAPLLFACFLSALSERMVVTSSRMELISISTLSRVRLP